MICKKSLLVSNALLYLIILGKEQLEELKKIKKVKEPVMTAEEKASKINKQEIKGTGKIITLITFIQGSIYKWYRVRREDK